MKIEEIMVTVLISALILWVQHWGIAQVMRKQFHPIVNYTLGVLAMAVPLGVLFWGWGSWDELRAMAGVIGGSGAAVAFAYMADRAAGWVHTAISEKQNRMDAEERERAIMAGLRQAIGVDHHVQK